MQSPTRLIQHVQPFLSGLRFGSFAEYKSRSLAFIFGGAVVFFLLLGARITQCYGEGYERLRGQASKIAHLVEHGNTSLTLPLPRPPLEDPNDTFKYTNIVDEPIDVVWNSTFAEIIGGYNDQACPVTSWQRNSIHYMKEGLKYWKVLADEENIPWFIAFGSLLGYVRDKNFTPYDGDLDIVMPSWAYSKLRKYTTPLPIVWTDEDYERPMLHLNPEFQIIPPTLQRKYNCDGTIAKEYVGFCTFTANMGRVGVGKRHVDVFSGDHDPIHDIFYVNDGRIEVFKPEVFLPMRRCTFLDMEVRCPNDPVSIVRQHYGPLTAELLPHRLCHEGEFKTKDQAPELHEEWKKRWIERVGPGIENEKANMTKYENLSNRKFCKKYPQDTKRSGLCNFPAEKAQGKLN